MGDKLGKRILFLSVSIFIMIMLSILLQRSSDNAQQTYDVIGFVRLKYFVFSIFGFILGAHNVIAQINKNGKWNIDYIVLTLCILSFIIGYSSLFNISFIQRFIIRNDLLFINGFVLIAFGYTFTMLFRRS